MRKKKINRKQLYYTLGFFVFCVFGLTVAYAALSTSLNISGSATVNESSWGIVIDEYPLDEFYGDSYEFVCSYNGTVCKDNYLTIGNGKIVTVPTVTNTSITNFKFSATIPGDGVVYAYKVVNTGSIPAKLEAINTSTPTYTSTNNNSSDVTWAQNNVEFVYNLGNENAEVEALKVGDIMCPGQVNYLLLGYNINESATSIPTGEVQISNAGIEYVFSQADTYSCPQ